MQYFSLLQADGEAKVIGCIRELVDDMPLPSCRREGRCRQQTVLSYEFLSGFRACEGTPKVEQTAVCSETDVDDAGRSYFAPQSMMPRKMENKLGARTQPCLTPLDMGKLPDIDPLCFI